MTHTLWKTREMIGTVEHFRRKLFSVDLDGSPERNAFAYYTHCIHSLEAGQNSNFDEFEELFGSRRFFRRSFA